jgi:hypothetical protein
VSSCQGTVLRSGLILGRAGTDFSFLMVRLAWASYWLWRSVSLCNARSTRKVIGSLIF